jgi:membrane protein involved in colicin uptake
MTNRKNVAKSVTAVAKAAKRTKAIAKGAKTTAKKPTKAAKAKSVKRAPRLDVDAKITVLASGKTNPRRAGTGPFKRYEALRKSRTVGAFLKAFPNRAATIRRAVEEKLIRVG